MVPRPLWNGTLSFGLVTVPVRLYPAIAEHKLQFHLVHEPDEGPIGYQKICKLEDEPVPDDEIVKAFEIRKGEHVQVADEDFEPARAGGGTAWRSPTSCRTPTSTRSCSPTPITSARARAARTSTRCSRARWRTRASRRSSSS